MGFRDLLRKRNANKRPDGSTAGHSRRRQYPRPNFVEQNIAAQHFYIDRLGVSKYRSTDISSANSKILENVAFGKTL